METHRVLLSKEWILKSRQLLKLLVIWRQKLRCMWMILHDYLPERRSSRWFEHPVYGAACGWRWGHYFWEPPCLSIACFASKCSRRPGRQSCASASTIQRSRRKSYSWALTQTWGHDSTPWTLWILKGGHDRAPPAKSRSSSSWSHYTFRSCCDLANPAMGVIP